MRDTDTLSPFIVMTSRRKSKRSVSLRTSSFIRLLSPFRPGLDREDREDREDCPGERSPAPRGESEDGGFSGEASLQAALSDPELHVSSLASLACSGDTGSHIPRPVSLSLYGAASRTPYLPG